MLVGIGLPRTGTRSLSEALDILGYNGTHKCKILGKTKILASKANYRIDNTFYMEKLNFSHECIYIITYRNYRIWRESISRFSNYNGPDIEEYNKICINFLKTKKARLLIYNVEDGWKPLCEFLNKNIPKVKFPNIR